MLPAGRRCIAMPPAGRRWLAMTPAGMRWLAMTPAGRRWQVSPGRAGMVGITCKMVGAFAHVAGVCACSSVS